MTTLCDDPGNANPALNMLPEEPGVPQLLELIGCDTSAEEIGVPLY